MIDVLCLNEHINAGVRRFPGEVFALEAAAGAVAAMQASGLLIPIAAVHDLWYATPGRILSPAGLEALEAPAPAVAGDREMPGVLRVLQMVDYDPGNAAYRYHSAINHLGPHASAFARWGNANPYVDLRQWDGTSQRMTLEALYWTAHVLHVHIDFRILKHSLGMLPRGILVRHYHGSLEPGFRDVLVEQALDDSLGAIQIGARLYHLQFSERMRWWPIPMPVRSYAALALAVRKARADDGVIRIAHSPTMRHRKGTEVLLEVVGAMQKAGAPVVVDLIEGLPHGEALRRRAACDITFDSFWLGMQGSGLEGAAMGQVVLAGDPDARAANVQHFGACPWTYANDAGALREALERFVEFPAWRLEEARRVHAFVRQHHDYPAVARRYAEILAEHLPGRGIVIPDLPAPDHSDAVLLAGIYGDRDPSRLLGNSVVVVPDLSPPAIEGDINFGPRRLEPAQFPVAPAPAAAVEADPVLEGAPAAPANPEPAAGRSALDAIEEEPFGAPAVSSTPAPVAPADRSSNSRRRKKRRGRS